MIARIVQQTCRFGGFLVDLTGLAILVVGFAIYRTLEWVLRVVDWARTGEWDADDWA